MSKPMESFVSNTYLIDSGVNVSSLIWLFCNVSALVTHKTAQGTATQIPQDIVCLEIAVPKLLHCILLLAVKVASIVGFYILLGCLY